MSESKKFNAYGAFETFFGATLRERDAEVMAAISGELARQRNQIELIASENIVSRAVLEATGSVLTNKYAEGYPGRSLVKESFEDLPPPPQQLTTVQPTIPERFPIRMDWEALSARRNSNPCDTY